MLINYSLNIKEFEGATFNVTTGDYSALMRLVCDNLEKARENAANDEERDMIAGYIKSFTEVRVLAVNSIDIFNFEHKLGQDINIKSLTKSKSQT